MHVISVLCGTFHLRRRTKLKGKSFSFSVFSLRTNKAKYQYNDSLLLWLFREGRRWWKKRSRESRVLCDVVPTHRTPAGGLNNSSPPPRHQSDPRQASLRFSQGGVERRSLSTSLNQTPPAQRMLILSSLQTFSLSSWLTAHLWILLIVFLINNNNKQEKKGKKKTFISFHQTISIMLT